MTPRWIQCGAKLYGSAKQGQSRQRKLGCKQQPAELCMASGTNYWSGGSRSALILASLESAISELQAPAWSWVAEPSLWPDAKPERASFYSRVPPCDGVSVLLDQRPLSRTLHTHRK